MIYIQHIKNFKGIVRFICFVSICTTFWCCFALSFTCVAAESDIPDTSKAKNVCLYNLNTQRTIYSKECDQTIFPGRAVKMMTGLVVCEMFSDKLGDTVTITQEMLTGSSGANIKLKADMRVTLENLLYGVLCGGGNDAALSLAMHCSGSVEAFVTLMNDTAKAWGLNNTYFTNPTGLDDANMYSTLSDIMILAKKAAGNQLYLNASTVAAYDYTPMSTQQSIRFFNRNSLISPYYATGYQNSNAQGLIAGNTDLGGYCVITYANKKGTDYICAVMGASEENDIIYSYEIANSLLSYGFQQFSYTKIIEGGTYIRSVPVELAMPISGSDGAAIDCIVAEDIYALVPQNVSTDTDLKYKLFYHYDKLHAPLNKGTVIGGIYITYNGNVITSARLVAAEDMSANDTLKTLDDLKLFFTGRIFIMFVALSIVGVAGYIYFLKPYRRRILRSKFR